MRRRRRPRFRPFVLGLTGSIGMGKTTAAAALRRLGLAVHDADAEVRRQLRRGPVAAAIAAAFPGTVRGRVVDRAELGRRVFGDAAALRRLEALLHPLVVEEERKFLARAGAERRPLVVLDIPLLFETAAEARCDATLVLTAPVFVQRGRVLRRRGMNAARLAGIEARQMRDREKRRRADFVISTGLDRRATLRALLGIVARLRRADTVPCRDRIAEDGSALPFAAGDDSLGVEDMGCSIEG